MLFGRSAWAGRSPRQPQAQSPLVQQPVQQQQAPFQPAPVQWAQPTQDMGYANQLAQYYAMQMPNQQVPGSAPMAQTQPVAQQPLPQQPVGQQPLPSGSNGTDWRDAYKAAKQDWRMQRPMVGPQSQAGGGDLLSQWRMQRPDKSLFRGH